MIKKSSKIIALGSILGIFALGLALHNNLILLPFHVVGEMDSVADFSNDRALLGASHNVFVGKVTQQLTTKDLGIGPETQFAVQVVSNIKGNLSGTVTVDQLGGYKNGILYIMDGDVSAGTPGSGTDSRFLESGKTYIFSTRYNPEQNWYTLISHPNAKKVISTDKNSSMSQLQVLADRDARVGQLKEAYKNEIPLEADVAAHNTRNSYASTQKTK